jgi:hypothetical protein
MILLAAGTSEAASVGGLFFRGKPWTFVPAFHLISGRVIQVTAPVPAPFDPHQTPVAAPFDFGIRSVLAAMEIFWIFESSTEQTLFTICDRMLCVPEAPPA